MLINLLFYLWFIFIVLKIYVTRVYHIITDLFTVFLKILLKMM